MPRMSILDGEEKFDFDSVPLFTSIERKRFFSTPPRVEKLIASLRTPTNKIWFLLMLGYFKASSRFYRNQFNKADVQYVARKLGYSRGIIDEEPLDETTYRRNRKIILDYLGWQPFNDQFKSKMLERIQPMVRSQSRLKMMLARSIDFLVENKVEVPTLRTLDNAILRSTKLHKEKLTSVVDASLGEDSRKFLDGLLEKIDSPTSCEEMQRYNLTLLKKISQSTKVSKIRAATEDLRTIREVFSKVEPALESLDLSHQGVQYYAQSVIKSRVFQVARRTEEDPYLHLVCFVTHQYRRTQDTLVDVFLQVIQITVNVCKRQHREKYFEDRSERRRSITAFASSVHIHIINPLSQIESVAFNNTLNADERVRQIQVILSDENFQRQEVEEKTNKMCKPSIRDTDYSDYFLLLESRSVKLQNKASEITKHVAFEGPEILMEAIQHFKERDGTVGKCPPMKFLNPEERNFIYDEQGKLRTSLYKVLLFIRMADAIKSGALNVAESFKYRSLDDYLIPQDEWQKNKNELLCLAELNEVEKCSHTLFQLKTAMDNGYQKTNQHIVDDENEHIQFRKDEAFIISTPKTKDDEERVENIFPEKRYIPLLEVMSSVHRASGFLDEFKHWQTKYNRKKPPESTFLAGIIGYGCNIGSRKIARISTLVNEGELENTINWYFSLDNIYAANDRILRLMDQIQLPNIYRHEAGKLHTSSDGQKFTVVVESLNANYSFKYHGHDKGASACSFIDERHLLFHSLVISSAEREAHYVIDGLMHNDVVKSDIHSTDTHGYSEVVFGILHLLGFSFAPRIKNLKRQQLYAFPEQRRRDYERQGYKILPDGYINVDLIEEHWDDIMRFVATIKLKRTTASQLFKRLNSYSKQNPLYKALKEFGKIIKTIFILKYIDCLDLRQAIEKQLNKGESSNKFSKAVSFGNNHEFLQGEKSEQEIADSCRRLIKNSIVCWNYLYLSQKILNEKDVERRQDLIATIRRGSVVVWQHINLLGEYDFSDEKLKDSVGLEVPKIRTLTIV